MHFFLAHADALDAAGFVVGVGWGARFWLSGAEFEAFEEGGPCRFDGARVVEPLLVFFFQQINVEACGDGRIHERTRGTSLVSADTAVTAEQVPAEV